ncbi:acetyl-CoA carboxylase carboxyltransferase subunit alpha [Candidatus Poribacteria bacterium]|nr:acetyl-CoA carboxylase carboxyltransferase subunit alpha [Candidatus Poribacteria bacterium]
MLDFEKPIMELESKIEELKETVSSFQTDFSREIELLEKKLNREKRALYSNISPWYKVLMQREVQRPRASDYINSLIRNKTELFGDRIYGDDLALIAGIGKFRNYDVVFLGQEKGKDTKERLERNFGLMHPEGYRKALRIMKLAEKFKKPVITFVDTQGAHPGVDAEERGQAFAIAENLAEMSALETPIICVVIGEGGSGGALGIGVADKILMLENAIYSVCLPETCSEILWRAHITPPESAVALKLTAEELHEFGIVDEIIKEPLEGAHRDIETAIQRVGRAVKKNLDVLVKLEIDDLVEQRYQKYRNIGEFIDENYE